MQVNIWKIFNKVKAAAQVTSVCKATLYENVPSGSQMSVHCQLPCVLIKWAYLRENIQAFC